MSHVLEELSSVLVILEVFGLQNFSLKSLTVKNSTNTSGLRVLYALALLIVVPSIVIFNVAINESLIPPQVNSRSLLMFIVQQSMNLGLLLVVCVSLIQSIASTRKVKKIFLNTKEIALTCQEEFRIVIDAKRIKNSALRRLANALSVPLVFHGAVTYSHADSTAEVIFMACNLIPILFLVMVVYKFVFFVGMVNSKLIFMRTLIEEVFNAKPIMIIDNINLKTLRLQAFRRPLDSETVFCSAQNCLSIPKSKKKMCSARRLAKKF
jgi:hypothetical protein